MDLLLNGHYSLTRKINIIDMAKEHGVSIVYLLPRCTDHLQPLDVSFMKPFKSYYTTTIKS